MTYPEWVFGKYVYQQDQQDQAKERHDLPFAPPDSVQRKPQHHE